LLSEGWGGSGRPLAAASAAAKRGALAELRGYFVRQQGHLGHARRLGSGQSIGSGLVGARGQVVGRRLKQAGARWAIRRVSRMATLCCAWHGDTWKPYRDACLY
jgi:hypothetical protein